LEQIYEGPIPVAARDQAHHGSPERRGFLRVRGEAAFFAAMASGQIETLRRRRAHGSSIAHWSTISALSAASARMTAALVDASRPSIEDAEIEKPRHTRGGASAVVDIPPPDPRPGLISAPS